MISPETHDKRSLTVIKRTILLGALATVAVTMISEVGALDITVRDVLALRTGDIIRLDNVRVNDPIVLKIGDRRKFLCRPGVVGNKLAVQVIKKLEDIDQTDFEELTTGAEEEI